MTDRALTRGEHAAARVTVHDVLRAANALAGCDLRVPSLKQSVSDYRFAAYRAAREMTGRSYPIIGRIFQRDHTTVIYGERKADPRVVLQIKEHLRGRSA